MARCEVATRTPQGVKRRCEDKEQPHAAAPRPAVRSPCLSVLRVSDVTGTYKASSEALALGRGRCWNVAGVRAAGSVSPGLDGIKDVGWRVYAVALLRPKSHPSLQHALCEDVGISHPLRMRELTTGQLLRFRRRPRPPEGKDDRLPRVGASESELQHQLLTKT